MRRFEKIYKKKRSDYYIKSIKRAIQVLNCFSSKQKKWTISKISKKLGFHKSSVHRILITLEDEGFITKNKVNQQYYLGIKLFELGYIAKGRIEIRNQALPFMKELSEITKETVALYITISTKERICIEKVESSYFVRRYVQTGETSPLYCGAAGKLLIAFLPKNKREKALSTASFKAFTPNTIINRTELEKQLYKIQQDGYATSFEERVPDSASIAVPIKDSFSEVVAALAVLGPISRFNSEKIYQSIPIVKEIAQKISICLGFSSRKLK